MINASVAPEDFEWPEYADEKTRIRAYTKRFANKSVLESFQEVYGVDLTGAPQKANELPKEYKVGDVIKTKILGVTKDAVHFDDINYKGTVMCATNLYKYRGLREGSNQTINAVVTDKKKDRITIDPITPMTNEWINKIVSDPTSQNVIGDPQTVLVRNLQLTSGGFTGKAVIPTTSQFVGEEVTVDAFIPGSQIVMNITDDFEQFIGTNVKAFVVNYIPRGESMSLICSVKNRLIFEGQCNMIEMFNRWCEDSPKWKEYHKSIHGGKVTGVLNSSKKCGVFIEVPELKITGMAKVDPDQLVNYKPGDDVAVRIESFEEEVYYNKDVQQIQHVDPYVIEDGVLRRCNLKPILEFV